MTELIQTEGIYDSVLRIWHGEDMVIALPQFIDPITETPFDLTSVTIELTLRPSFNHATRFQLLTTAGSAGIIKENATQGLAIIKLAQATVEANVPISPHEGWAQFMTLGWTDPDLGALTKLFARGPLYVYPAKDAATA